MDILRSIEQSQLKDNLPKVDIGDHVKVHVKVTEGKRERIQIFEGTVISKKGSSIRETFNVRKISYGVGVERIFPLHSPIIDTIEVVRKGVVRRAKLYYLRDRVGKSANIKAKIIAKKK